MTKKSKFGEKNGEKKIVFFGLYGLFNLNHKFSNIFFQKLLLLIMILVQKFWKSYKNLVHSKFLNILIFLTIHLFW